MTNSQDMVAQIEALGEKLGQAKASINRRFIGQERVVDLILTGCARESAKRADQPVLEPVQYHKSDHRHLRSR